MFGLLIFGCKKKLEEENSVTCVKCGASMRSGTIVERDPDELIVAGLGLYWRPARRGKNVFKTVELIAYACPECGYVEQYVRDLEKDKDKILLGTKDRI